MRRSALLTLLEEAAFIANLTIMAFLDLIRHE